MRRLASVVSVIVFCGLFLSAGYAQTTSKVYKGQIIVPKELRSEGVPKKLEYIFNETEEGAGLLKIFTGQYDYWVFVSDWEKGIFGPTNYCSYLEKKPRWRWVAWKDGAPLKEEEKAVVERIRFFMNLIRPHLTAQKEKGSGN